MNLFRALTALVCLTSVSASAVSQTADQGFPKKTHDFGTVAVASKTEVTFPVINPFNSTMHIREVRRSCGCTTPTVLTPYIAPGQKGAIHAKFNTDTFKGKKGATLTVVIDQPYYAEVRLRVDGYIRSDIVISPGSIDFGKIKQGNRATKTTKLYYAGRNDWRIVDVQSNRDWLLPSVKETARGGGRVNYELSVAVREDVNGSFQDEIVIITNDRSKPRVPVRVTGKVESPLTIAPSAVALGSLKPGEAVQQKLVLVGAEPFVVESIDVEGWKVDFPPTAQPRKTHVLVCRFTPTGEKTGRQKNQIQIKAKGQGSIEANAILTADIRVQ